jgi:hypothetical protein
MQVGALDDYLERPPERPERLRARRGDEQAPGDGVVPQAFADEADDL